MLPQEIFEKKCNLTMYPAFLRLASIGHILEKWLQEFVIALETLLSLVN